MPALSMIVPSGVNLTLTAGINYQPIGLLIWMTSLDLIIGPGQMANPGQPDG
jgi:hypothetical protein